MSLNENEVSVSSTKQTYINHLEVPKKIILEHINELRQIRQKHFYLTYICRAKY